MRWGWSYVDRFGEGVASRSGACKLYCHVDLPPSAFDPPPPSRRRCGPHDAPCRDCAACTVVTVVIRGRCSLPSVLSQIRAQAGQLQALDLNGLQPPLGAAEAAALKDIMPSLSNLLALSLDNHRLHCDGVQALSCELVKLTQLQALSCANNAIEQTGATVVAHVLSSLTGLQTLNLGYNDILAAGAASLACVLSSLTGLQTLDLGFNRI